MKLKREKLLGILEDVKPALAKKEIIEESGNFIFDHNRIITYNDQICVIHPLKCDFVCSVPSEEFYNLIKKLTDEIVTLSMDGEWLTIKTKTTKAELAAAGETSILELVEQFPDFKPWKKIPDKLLQAIKWCAFSASRNATLPYLTSVYISNKYVMATDELRISKYDLPAKMADDMMIPAEAAKQLLAFKPIKYSVKDGWCFFQNEHKVVFCTRVIDGKYPARQYLNEFEFEGKKVLLPAKLSEALEVAEVLADGQIVEEKRIDIKLKDGQLFIKAEKQDIGKLAKVMKVKYNKRKAITMTINPIFLNEILTKTNKVVIGDDRALFKTGPFSHLVSLFTEE
ncbi:MAG: hypothetical protein DRJ03_01065 [Chloroflexi bacterium]|nr:MAG: hypothetical protein DRJ03_01065 [Chloroflexota bacterium]